MKLNGNVTFYAGSEDTVCGRQTMRRMERNDKGDGKSGSATIFAGDLGIKGDSIAMKRQMAQKKALKVVSDAWGTDSAIDDEINLHRERARQLRADKEELGRTISDIKESERMLQKEYGIDDDSQEQKDAELLMKWKEIQGGAGDGKHFTQEESERLNTFVQDGMIVQDSLTDYQKRLLDMHEGAVNYMVQSDRLDLEIEQEYKIVAGIKLERLKSTPMLDARKEAEQITEEAGKEILGMLFEEGKEHIDEEQKEQKEKAEEIEEKKEEQEELIEKRKEEKEDAEELTKEILEGADNVSGKSMEEIKQEVKDIVTKMKLVEEDIKGAKVDESV